MLTHTALEVDAEGAVQWAAEHPGFYIFPGRMVLEVDADTGRESFRKQPLGRWTEDATNDPDEIRALWHRHGDLGVVCVACAPSGIWVLDQDHDLPDDAAGEEWKTILEAVQISRSTLVLQSCTKARPHYVFRQGTEFVAEGTWIAGEVKATGIIFVSEAPPLVDAPIAVAPQGLLDRLKKGRVRGSRGRTACSSEEMWNWILNTPAPEDLILDEVTGGRFLDAIIEKLNEKVDAGAHRRMATLDAVFQAGIEAEAGCYPAETAYLAIKGAYRELRESRRDGKGWNSQREADYDLMWKALVPDIRDGEYDDKVDATRTDAMDRYGMWAEPDEDINDVIAAILDRSTVVLPPSPTVGEPVSSTPPGAPAEPSATAPVSSTPAPAPAPAPADDDDDWGIPATPAAPAPFAAPKAEPKLAEAAFWGPHGDLIEALRGRTESSDVGVLGALLAFSGAAMAGSAHWLVGADIHGPNDFILNIGVSSAARKSSGLSLVDKIFYDHGRMSAPGGPAVSYLPRILRGVGSGEALIRMWTPALEDDGAGGKTEIWPERRTLMVEGEASALWKKAHREASTLSDVFCQIWDQTDVATHAVTSGSLSLNYERYLMGFIGCSTLHVAVTAAKAGDGADSKSGFANRFVWLYLPDSGIDLPFGADLPEKAVRRYQDQLGLFDGTLGRIGETGFGVRAGFAPDARDRWAEVYGTVKRSKGAAGFIEGMLARGESHVLRLALNYWLAAGGDPREVSLPSLEAALAVWQYAKDSVEYIFGGSTGSRDADNLVAELEVRGGWATMNELRADLNKNTLAGLVKAGVQAGVMIEGTIATGKPGRPPRAVALTSWLGAGTLVAATAGIGRERGIPLEAVTWDR